MKKKRFFTSIVLLAVLGAVLVASQIVWASDNSFWKQSSKAELTNMQGIMNDGNMNHMMKTMTDRGMNNRMKGSNTQDMMKMMATPEGKQIIEKCQELLKQNTENKSEGER